MPLKKAALYVKLNNVMEVLDLVGAQMKKEKPLLMP